MFDFLRSPKPKSERIDPVLNSVDYSNVPSSDIVRMGEIFEIGQTSAGVNVTEYSAMRVAVVASCVRLIAGALASMPINIYERLPNGRRITSAHDYWWLLNEEACPMFTAATFMEFMTGQVLLRGDGLAMIVRKEPSPKAYGFIPLRRNNVAIKRNGDRLQYTVMTNIEGTAGYFTLDQDDVLHFPGFGFDGISSLSVIGHAARQSIGTAIMADEFAGKFYGSGAQLQHVITSAGVMTLEQQQNLRQSFVARYGNGQGPNGIPLVLTEGLGIKELSMSPVDAQLLEARKFQVVDIARAFGVPPFMIGDVEKTTAWGTGIEQLSIGFLKYTLNPHLVRFEQELNRKLFPRNVRNFVEFDPDGLMRGDATARAAYYKAALGGTQNPGWLTQNEVRTLENFPPDADGDELYAPSPSDTTAPTEDPAPDPNKGTQSEPTDPADPSKQ